MNLATTILSGKHHYATNSPMVQTQLVHMFCSALGPSIIGASRRPNISDIQSEIQSQTGLQILSHTKLQTPEQTAGNH